MVAGETLNRLHEMVEEERTLAAGKARMPKDSIEMGQRRVKEAESKALADFAAKEGLDMGGEAGTPGPRTTGSGA